MGDSLQGKVAVVTGAGSVSETRVGIGQAIAIVLAREGASVVIVDRSAENAARTRAAIEATPGRGLVHVADVSRIEDCEAMVRAAVEAFGGLDILVNNAGISKHFSVVDTTPELFEEIIAVNLRGSFMACKYAVPALIERGGGSIVNIASVAAIRDTSTTHPAYASSKGAILGMTVDLAGEYGRDNIRVNAVLPGSIASPLQESLGGPVSDDIRGRLNLLGRMGTGWDIAHTVCFLCTDEAAYLTGLTLPVDGGATIAMASSWNRPDRRP